MAKKYIECEAALEEVNGSLFTMSMCLSEQECVGMQRAQAIIAKRIISLPAADVRPVVRGRWVDSKMDGVPSHCSECNYPIDRFYKTRFCPNCGADMR